MIADPPPCHQKQFRPESHRSHVCVCNVTLITHTHIMYYTHIFYMHCYLYMINTYIRKKNTHNISHLERAMHIRHTNRIQQQQHQQTNQQKNTTRGAEINVEFCYRHGGVRRPGWAFAAVFVFGGFCGQRFGQLLSARLLCGRMRRHRPADRHGRTVLRPKRQRKERRKEPTHIAGNTQNKKKTNAHPDRAYADMWNGPGGKEGCPHKFALAACADKHP